MSEQRDQAALLAAARSLSVDRVTAEVVSALQTAGIRTLLLKGPVLTRWLSYDGKPRSYVDTDLLVPPHDFDSAERVLADLGFARYMSDREAGQNARMWTRRTDQATIDLHHNIWGIGVSPAELWNVLARNTERSRVGGVEVEHLDAPGRALHVALHAAQHGTVRRPREDLERALARGEPEVWDRAAVLAQKLQAVPAFAEGLRSVPSGELEATRLRLPRNTSLAVALRVRSEGPNLAVGYESVLSAPTVRQKLTLLGQALVPTPAFMRARSPLANRGPVGLFLAYLLRPWWVLAKTPGALLTLRSVRKETRGG